MAAPFLERRKMVGYLNKEKDIAIGIAYVPKGKKPRLIVQQGNTQTSYASFNSENAAVEFVDMIATFFNLEKLDWQSDEVKEGFKPNYKGGAE